MRRKLEGNGPHDRLVPHDKVLRVGVVLRNWLVLVDEIGDERCIGVRRGRGHRTGLLNTNIVCRNPRRGIRRTGLPGTRSILPLSQEATLFEPLPARDDGMARFMKAGRLRAVPKPRKPQCCSHLGLHAFCW